MSTAANEYLSFGDSLFLFLERPATPLNIAAISVFEGEIARDEFCSFIDSKLPNAPKFLQKVVAAPFNVGLPHWEMADHFNIEQHIHEITLERGSEAEYRTVAGKILSRVMDRSRPLWDITLVHGVEGTNTGVIVRAHHAVADGISGVNLLRTLMDSSPKVRRIPKRKKISPSANATDPIAALAGDLVSWWLGSVGRVLTMERDLFGIAEQVVSRMAVPPDGTAASLPGSNRLAKFDGASQLLPELSAPAQRFPFNRVCEGPQKFTWAEIPFDRIHRVKSHYGVTVNDVLLTIVSSAYRSYAISQGEQARHPIRMVIPVNTRGNGSSADLGNQITFAPIDVPLASADVRELLMEVHQRTQMMKSTGLAELVSFAGMALGLVPPPLQAVLASLASQLPISLCNAIFTNVPGPAEPLYILGHKMIRCYPYVPIGGLMALNCAALTYNGTAYFGFSADAPIAQKIDSITKSLLASFKELERSTVRPARTTSPKRARRTRRVAAERPKRIVKSAPMEMPGETEPVRPSVVVEIQKESEDEKLAEIQKVISAAAS